MTRRELFKTLTAGLVSAPLAKAAEPVKQQPQEMTEGPVMEPEIIGSAAGTTIFCTFVYSSDTNGKWEKKVIRKDVFQP